MSVPAEFRSQCIDDGVTEFATLVVKYAHLKKIAPGTLIPTARFE